VREGKRAEGREAEADKPRPKEEYTPLPAGAASFKGYLIGMVIEIADRTATLAVTDVIPAADSAATDPGKLKGASVKVHFYAFGDGQGGYAPDADLVRAFKNCAKAGGPVGGAVTVKVVAKGDKALIATRIWPGEKRNLEQSDAPARQRDPQPDPPARVRDAQPDPPARVRDPQPDPPARQRDPRPDPPASQGDSRPDRPAR